MKSHSILAVSLLASALLLAGCGPSATSGASSIPAEATSTPAATTSVATANKFLTYKGSQFLEEAWDTKKVAYQFVSTAPYAIAEHNIQVDVLVNLYDDGSFRADQRNDKSSTSYYYFGAWSPKTEDGFTNIEAKTLFMQDGADDTVQHAYSYTLVESSTHTYTWTFDFALMVHQYFRTVDMAGSSTAKYATLADFHNAVDVIDVSTEFEGTVNETATKLTYVRLLGLSNGVARLYAYYPYGSSLIRMGKWESGVFATVKDMTNGATTSCSWDFTSANGEVIPAKLSSTVTSDVYSDVNVELKWTSKMSTTPVNYDVTATLKKVDVNVSITGEKPAAATSSSAA